jgi:hypothetical protein
MSLNTSTTLVHTSSVLLKVESQLFFLEFDDSLISRLRSPDPEINSLFGFLC